MFSQTNNNNICYLLYVPRDIQLQILWYLEALELTHFAQLSHSWKNFFSTSDALNLWNMLLKKDFEINYFLFLKEIAKISGTETLPALSVSPVQVYRFYKCAKELRENINSLEMAKSSPNLISDLLSQNHYDPKIDGEEVIEKKVENLSKRKMRLIYKNNFPWDQSQQIAKLLTEIYLLMNRHFEFALLAYKYPSLIGHKFLCVSQRYQLCVTHSNKINIIDLRGTAINDNLFPSEFYLLFYNIVKQLKDRAQTKHVILPVPSNPNETMPFLNNISTHLKEFPVKSLKLVIGETTQDWFKQDVEIITTFLSVKLKGHKTLQSIIIEATLDNQICQKTIDMNPIIEHIDETAKASPKRKHPG